MPSSQPIPPPSVSPPTPVSANVPPGTARPAATVAASRSCHKAPPSTIARRPAPSTRTPRTAEVDGAPAVNQPVTGDAVSPASDADGETGRASLADRRGDVIARLGSHDGGRPAIDHPVERRPGADSYSSSPGRITTPLSPASRPANVRVAALIAPPRGEHAARPSRCSPGSGNRISCYRQIARICRS